MLVFNTFQHSQMLNFYHLKLSLKLTFMCTFPRGAVSPFLNLDSSIYGPLCSSCFIGIDFVLVVPSTLFLVVH